MSKKIIILIIIIFIALLILVIARGPEDTWLCTTDGWVKHGVPSAEMPAEACDK